MSSGEPRLSIGLPVYNGERYLAESLDALLGQTYKNFELIISDNASTDGTAAICREYARQDPRIRYLRQSKNIGAAPNHNFVLSEAKGELFKWAAADDLYTRDLLERCIEALDEHPGFVLADSWTAAISDSGEVVQALPYPLATDSLSAPVRFRSMLFGASEIGAGLIQADDMYGVIRTDVLRRIPPHGSFFHADRVSDDRDRAERPVLSDPRLAVLPARSRGPPTACDDQCAQLVRQPRPASS